MRVVLAIARWKRSRVSPSAVSGQSSRWVMKTSTLKALASSWPSRARCPPIRSVAVKPARISIRMSGEKALERVIARAFEDR